MKKYLITFNVLISLFAASYVSADIIKLKTGVQFEGNVREEDRGYWIDGILFSHDEVERIEEGSFDSNLSADEKARRKINKDKQLKEYYARLDRNSTAIRGNLSRNISVENLQSVGNGSPVMLVLGLFAILMLYVLVCYPFARMAQRLHVEGGWLAYIPIFQILLLLRIADKPAWWFFLLFVPFVNIVIVVIIYMGIAEAHNRPSWYGVFCLVPIASMILPWYFAFCKLDVDKVEIIKGEDDKKGDSGLAADKIVKKRIQPAEKGEALRIKIPSKSQDSPPLETQPGESSVDERPEIDPKVDIPHKDSVEEDVSDFSSSGISIPEDKENPQKPPEPPKKEDLGPPSIGLKREQPPIKPIISPSQKDEKNKDKK